MNSILKKRRLKKYILRFYTEYNILNKTTLNFKYEEINHLVKRSRDDSKLFVFYF